MQDLVSQLHRVLLDPNCESVLGPVYEVSYDVPTSKSAGYFTPCTVTLLAPNLALKDLKKGGPANVPTLPNSAVPRAKIMVTSVQQLLFTTPFSFKPPPFPCAVQARSFRIGAATAVLANAAKRICWSLIMISIC